MKKHILGEIYLLQKNSNVNKQQLANISTSEQDKHISFSLISISYNQ